MSVQCVSKALFMLECQIGNPNDCPAGYTCNVEINTDGGTIVDSGTTADAGAGVVAPRGLCIDDQS